VSGSERQRRRLAIADELRGIATTGLHFTEGAFDRERYERLLELAARLAALETGEETEALLGLFREADAGYVTPKLDVRMAVFREERVLLVRERSDGRWAMPGGFVDIGDTPSEAAVRETVEEAGLVVRATRLVGLFDRRLRPEVPPHLFHIWTLVFTGEERDSSAEPRPDPTEVSEAAFHPIDALPELSLGRTSPAFIEHARRVALDPAALPAFD
jgi:ADP-ribose pyrophosphatase YjhB (NUDIX family)